MLELKEHNKHKHLIIYKVCEDNVSFIHKECTFPRQKQSFFLTFSTLNMCQIFLYEVRLKKHRQLLI